MTDLQKQAPVFIQHVVNCLESQEFSTRKTAADCILNLAKACPLALKSYRKEVNQILNQLRFDKIKPVRDAALDVLNLFKEIPDLYYSEEEQLREQQLKDQ